jgi:ribosomal subunit interface protein
MAAVTPEITGRNFEVTPDIRALLEGKLDRVEDRLFDDVISVRVVLSVEKYRNICEIFIVGKEQDVKVVQESSKSMPDAINAALDHVKRQAQKNREKLRDHHKNGAGPSEITDIPVLEEEDRAAGPQT